MSDSTNNVPTVQEPQFTTNDSSNVLCCLQPPMHAQGFDHFWNKHVKNVTPEDDTCAICREPYGRFDLSVGLYDEPVKIVGIEGCTHTFGRACLFKSTTPPSNRCPLSRTTLYTELEWLERANIPELEAELLHSIAWTCMCDLATARAVISSYWEESEPDEASKMAYEHLWLELDIHDCIEKSWKIQDLLDKLADSCSVTEEDVKRFADPEGRDILGWYLRDPFVFRNWHISNLNIGSVVRAAILSNKGQRLYEMFVKHFHKSALEGHQSNYQRELATIKESWLESPFGVAEEADFVAVILEVLWGVAGPETVPGDMIMEEREKSSMREVAYMRS